MKNKKMHLTIIILLLAYFVMGQSQTFDKYWDISSSQNIVWNTNKANGFPHEDNIEMSGKKVSAIIYYKINENKELEINREIIVNVKDLPLNSRKIVNVRCDNCKVTKKIRFCDYMSVYNKKNK